MINNYEDIKNNQVIPKVRNHFSFNSLLCQKDETNEKLTRFRIKLNDKKVCFEERILPSVDERTCAELIFNV